MRQPACTVHWRAEYRDESREMGEGESKSQDQLGRLEGEMPALVTLAVQPARHQSAQSCQRRSRHTAATRLQHDHQHRRDQTHCHGNPLLTSNISILSSAFFQYIMFVECSPGISRKATGSLWHARGISFRLSVSSHVCISQLHHDLNAPTSLRLSQRRKLQAARRPWYEDGQAVMHM